VNKSPLKKVKLDAQQRKLWEDTLAALSWVAPGFVHIIYEMLNNTGDDEVALFTEDIAYTAATDGFQIILKPSSFFGYTLMERVFIVLHETMHEILNHCRMSFNLRKVGKVTVAGKTLPYDLMFANIVQDLVINAILIASKLGLYNKAWLFDAKLQAETKDWIDLYFELWKDMPKVSKLDGFDQHMEPNESKGEDPNEAQPRNDTQWEIAVAAGMEIQRAHGKLPQALEHFFDMVLNPKVPWAEHVRGLIARMSNSGGYDWHRLDRRLIVRGIGAPSMTGFGADIIVVGGDTSGSVFMDKTLIARWIGEIGGVIEDLNPREVHVVWCDWEVKRVDICTDPSDVRQMIYKGVPGGGGTSFEPVFRYIEENDLRPDALIYLTDGFGTFPKQQPDFPVVWGNISGKAATYPWGDVVDVPTSAEA
jgi:predicted metal-dependent peptidase